MKIKKMSLLFMSCLFLMNVFNVSAEEEESGISATNSTLNGDHNKPFISRCLYNEKMEDSFVDEVIYRLKCEYRPLREGFDLIELNYNKFVESQRSFIAEHDQDGDESEDESCFLHDIVVKAENEIIEKMNVLLLDGCYRAIDNHVELDSLTMKIFNYAIDYKLSLGELILQHIRTITGLCEMAIIENNMSVINLLIASGIDLNAKSDAGDTPLMTAAHFKYVEIVQLFIDQDVNVNDFNADGQTALIQAVLYASHTKSKDSSIKVINKLINAGAGASINHQDGRGYTALMWAARCKDSEIVQSLITAGANVNVQSCRGQTALIVAIESRPMGDRSMQIDTVKMLIKAGADIYVTDTYGCTAMSQATDFMKTVITQALLEHESGVTQIPTR